MRNEVINKGKGKPIASSDILKATSLLYLKEALLKDEFETCAGLVQSAKRFGAQESEIKEVLAEAVREKKGR